jgi:hypothetical protein
MLRRMRIFLIFVLSLSALDAMSTLAPREEHLYNPFNLEIACFYKNDCALMLGTGEELFSFRYSKYKIVESAIENARIKKLYLKIAACTQCKQWMTLSKRPLRQTFRKIASSNISLDKHFYSCLFFTKDYGIITGGKKINIWLPAAVYESVEMHKLAPSNIPYFYINENALNYPDLFFRYFGVEDFMKPVAEGTELGDL